MRAVLTVLRVLRALLQFLAAFLNKDMDEEKSLKSASEEQKAGATGDLAETVKDPHANRQQPKKGR